MAVETCGAFGPLSMQFNRELGHRLKLVTNEPRSLQFLIQRISVAIQRGNAASILGTMVQNVNSDDTVHNGVFSCGL